MKTLLHGLWFAFLIGCAGAQNPAASAVAPDGGTLRVQPAGDQHRVTILGTPELDDAEALATWHASLRRLLERSQAELLLVDVEQGRIAQLERGDIGPATSAEHDFVTVIGPWALERGVEIRGISAWTDSAIRDDADYAIRFPHGPIERTALSRRAMYMAALIEHGGGQDVAWLNSAEFAELSADAERWSALYNNEDRGEAGLFRVAARTLANIEDILASRTATRVLIVVPATSRFFVADGLAVLDEIVLLEPDPLFE